MAEFARIESDNSKKDEYVQNQYPDQGDNNTGQLAPYKVMSGATRGDQQIKGRYMVVDERGVIRLVMGFDPGKF